jgi:AcrR family transcriptional regulator
MVDLILSAAARVLVKHGYDDASTNRIAEVAGVSVGSLYQYFPNKEAIVAALIERHDGEMWSTFTRLAAACAGQPLAQSTGVVLDALFEAHLIEPELHRVLHEQVPRVGKLSRLRETNRKARELVAGILRAQAHEIDVHDIDAAAFVVVESVEAIIHQSIELPDVDPATMKREAATLVLRYLRVSGASESRMG